MPAKPARMDSVDPIRSAITQMGGWGEPGMFLHLEREGSKLIFSLAAPSYQTRLYCDSINSGLGDPLLRLRVWVLDHWINGSCESWDDVDECTLDTRARSLLLIEGEGENQNSEADQMRSRHV